MASKLTKAWFQGTLSFAGSSLRVYEGDAFTNSHVAVFASAEDAATAVIAKNSHDELLAIAKEAHELMLTFSADEGDEADQFATRIKSVLEKAGA